MIAEISLIIIFVIVSILGAYLIYRQVALVKKEELSWMDFAKCGFYGIIFSSAVMIVIGMAFIFAINSPDLWEYSVIKPQKTINPLMLFIPLTICLVYITIYPLLDFIYISISSESKKGLTVFHNRLGETLINRFDSQNISILLAIGLYFLMFFLPPLLMSLMGIPLILIWSTWFLVYPLMILTYYGAKGYIAGITNAYVHLPDPSRSLFLPFEDTRKTFKEFIDDPFSRIIIGLMLFVFVWQWISMIQTLLLVITGSMAISPYSYSGMVFITLLFGVIGYFTRFWGRKIQYRAIDIYFAAYLMAGVGMNVFVNFLIVNIEKLEVTLNAWLLTAPITRVYLFFAFPAVIEEIVLILFTSYYFLVRTSNFNINFFKSKITECEQTFDPIPLFNFIKSNNPKLRIQAEEALMRMYERIPLKTDININDIKYKHPLIDGLSNPHPNTRRISYNILLQLEENIPEKILPWIINALNSPNYEKSILIAKSVLESPLKVANNIPIPILLNLINDPEWRLKRLALKIISKVFDHRKNLIELLEIYKLLNDPDEEIQAETLKILSTTSYQIPYNLLFQKIEHINERVRTQAIKNIVNIKDDQKKRELLSRTTLLLHDPSTHVRTSILESLANIGNIDKHISSIEPLLNAMVAHDEHLRKAAISALKTYNEENPKDIDVKSMIKRIDEDKIDILLDFLCLIGDFWNKKIRFWNKNPEEILNVLLKYLKFDNNEVREKVSDIIVEKFSLNPGIIFNKLIQIPDISTFVTKGIISRTLIKIAEKYPREAIPRLNEFKDFDKNEAKINAMSALDGCIEKHPDLVDINPFISILETTKDEEIKNEASKVLTKIAKMSPEAIKPIVPKLTTLIKGQKTSVKITVGKSLLKIAEDSPELIEVDFVKNLLSEDDAFIKESAIKILGHIGKISEDYEAIFNLLLQKSLKDKDWIVREAAITSLGRIIPHVENKSFIVEKLISLLEEEEEPWVQSSILNLLSEVKEITPESIPLDSISKLTSHDNDKVRQAAAKFLHIYSKGELEPIIDSIFSLLDDPSNNVRDKMINSIVSIIHESGIKKILPRLLEHLSDEYSMRLNRSIALILGRSVKYENEEIKNRVISVLEIRCQMSQDPVICRILHELEES